MPFEPIIESLRSVWLTQKENLPDFVEPQSLDITFLGVVDEQARALFSAYDVPVMQVPSGKLRRYASPKNIVDLLVRLPVGIMWAFWRMLKIMPDVVISKGGYGSVPVVLAAWFYRIPVLLHESDVVPGKTNSWLVRLATAVTIGFPQAQGLFGKHAHKLFVTGTPVRPLESISKEEARRFWKIPEGVPMLLVMGGSQGAKQINEVLLQVLPKLLPDMAILHITGKEHYPAVQKVTSELLAQLPHKNNYQVVPYLDDTMTAALVAADAIVSRSGASSLAEIARLRKPSLLIPYPEAAGDHQRKNAQVFLAAGAALVLDPQNLGRNLFYSNVKRLMTDEEARAIWVRNLEKVDHPEAGQKIAELALRLASGFAPKR